MPASASELEPDEKAQIDRARGAILGVYLLALFVCMSRLYVRRFILHTFRIDDWACIAGLLSTTGFAALSLAVIEYGAGRHLANIPVEDATKFYLFYYSMTVSFIFFAFPIKTSLLLHIRRIVPHPYVKNLSAGIWVFLLLFTISGCTVDAFFCNPPRYVYDIHWISRPDRAEHCFSNDVSYALLVYQGALAFVTDLAILLLPIPALLKMTVTKGKWFAIATIFASAVVASVTPIIRLTNAKFQRDTGVTDLTFYSLPLLYWTNVEYNLGMVAGSMGTLRPLFAKLARVGLSSSSSPLACCSSPDDDETSPPPWKVFFGGPSSWSKWPPLPPPRRRASTRVQGDSVLFTTGKTGKTATSSGARTAKSGEAEGGAALV